MAEEEIDDAAEEQRDHRHDRAVTQQHTALALPGGSLAGRRCGGGDGNLLIIPDMTDGVLQVEADYLVLVLGKELLHSLDGALN